MMKILGLLLLMAEIRRPGCSMIGSLKSGSKNKLSFTDSNEVQVTDHVNLTDHISSYNHLTSSGIRRSIINSAKTRIVYYNLTEAEDYNVRYGSSHTPKPLFGNKPSQYPRFIDDTPVEVTVMKGKNAYLHCHIINLGAKSVSWVRHADIHVLTVGRLTFANDDRFVAMNKPGTDMWTLQFQYPQPSESGKYECQVSSKPKLSRVITLNVVEPQAVIPTGPEIYVDSGSPLNITCLVPDSPQPPERLFWYHKDKMLQYDGSSRGLIITTQLSNESTWSILLIPSVAPSDDGIYTCAPQGGLEAAVTVRVLDDKAPQAMQGSGCSYFSNSQDTIPKKLLLLLVLYRLLMLCSPYT